MPIFWFLDKSFDRESFTKKKIIKKTATSIMFIDLALILQIIQKSIFGGIFKLFQLPVINIPLSLCGIFNGIFMGYLSGIIFDFLELVIGLILNFNIAFTFIYGLIGAIAGFTFLFVKKISTFFALNEKNLFSFVMGIFLFFFLFLGVIEIFFFSKICQILSTYYSLVISKIILILFFLLLISSTFLIIIFWKQNKFNKSNNNIYLAIFLTFFFQYLIISLFLDPFLLNIFYHVPYKLSYLKVLIQPLAFIAGTFLTAFFYKRIQSCFFSNTIS